MEAVLTRPENDIVDAERSLLPSRKAKVIRRAVATPSDAELEARFANQEMPQEPNNNPEWQDIIKANSGKTIKPIEKWL